MIRLCTFAFALCVTVGVLVTLPSGNATATRPIAPATVRSAQLVTCTGGSADGPVALTINGENVNYAYHADTTCPEPVFYVAVASWVEASLRMGASVNWQLAQSRPSEYDFGAGVDRAEDDDIFWVEPFNISGPGNCRRIVSLHAEVTAPDSVPAVGWSFSPGACF